MEIIDNITQFLGKEYYLYELSKQNMLASNVQIEKRYLPKHKGPTKITIEELRALLRLKKTSLRCHFLLGRNNFQVLKKSFPVPFFNDSYRLDTLDRSYFILVEDQFRNKIFICRDRASFLVNILSLKVNIKYNPRSIVAYMHGAAVDRDGAVLFLGSQNTGKSSLCYYLWQHGCRILGDDKIIITHHKDKIFISSPINTIRLRNKVPIKEDSALRHHGRKYLEITNPNMECLMKGIYVLKRSGSEKTSISDMNNYDELINEFDNQLYSYTDKIGFLETYFRKLIRQKRVKCLQINWKEKNIAKKLRKMIALV